MKHVNSLTGYTFKFVEKAHFFASLVTLPRKSYIYIIYSRISNVYNFNVFLISQYKKSENGSEKKKEILKKITETQRHRTHLDGSMELIGTFLYGPHKGFSILNSVREPGMPLVDDWGCLKSMVTIAFYFDYATFNPIFATLFSSHTIQFRHRFGCSKHIVAH
jgi:hypothetical protein